MTIWEKALCSVAIVVVAGTGLAALLTGNWALWIVFAACMILLLAG